MDKLFWGIVLFILVVAIIWYSNVKEIAAGAVILLLLGCALVYMIIYFWGED